MTSKNQALNKVNKLIEDRAKRVGCEIIEEVNSSRYQPSQDKSHDRADAGQD